MTHDRLYDVDDKKSIQITALNVKPGEKKWDSVTARYEIISRKLVPIS